MTVHFIGAGPGADLISCGRQAAGCCPVASMPGRSSRLNAAALRAGDKLIDTAPMSPRRDGGRIHAHKAGHDVARLHSGDLSVWSAVAEQIHGWKSTAFLHADAGGPLLPRAALRRELTIPEVAQSLVLTRVSGRASKMPPGETLAGFGRTGATLAIHLAIHAIDRVVAELTPHYGGDCPVAIVFRASWPDERVLTGTLATIEAQLAADPMERTAIIFVGRSLAAEDFGESSLYDAHYQRRFRGRDGL